MIRAATLALLILGAWAECDSSTCFVCQQDPKCGWWATASGDFADCRTNRSELASLGLTYTANGSCPFCQAGSCTDCTSQAGCNWYSPPSVLLSAKCANNTPPTPAPISGSYTKVTTCPPCKDQTGCNACFGNVNCSWYQLPGSTGGKCAEASPGFAYSKVATSAFCAGGNPCAGVDTCIKCKAVNVTQNGTCAWLKPKSAFTNFYNAKCDFDSGVLDQTFYDTETGTCPLCTGTSCVTCKAEANCKWVAVSVGGVTSFGQCLKTADATPGGKSDIAVCPAACQLYSCSQCIANPDCRWFSASGAGLSDTCDRATDTSQHPFTTVIGQGGTCPVCKASRCFECNNEATCGWYVNTLAGFDVAGSGDCGVTTASHSNERLVPNTDKKCDGAQSGSAVFYPSLAAAAAVLFVSLN